VKIGLADYTITHLFFLELVPGVDLHHNRCLGINRLWTAVLCRVRQAVEWCRNDPTCRTQQRGRYGRGSTKPALPVCVASEDLNLEHREVTASYLYEIGGHGRTCTCCFL
jgi:hypothetical protein